MNEPMMPAWPRLLARITGVVFLLTYGVSDKVFPNLKESGFQLVGAFRDGFLHGGKNCDVGL